MMACSTEVIKQLCALLGNKIPIIGCGGILSANDAREKIAAGASLVQIYTGLIYQGPKLIKDISRSGLVSERITK
jgi:dihydroorotate dehydrogenase